MVYKINSGSERKLLSAIVNEIYDYLNSEKYSMKEKNKWLFILLAENIKNIDLINLFIDDEMYEKLPISLVKTTLIMVENKGDINSKKAQLIYDKFLEGYPHLRKSKNIIN